MNKLLLRRFLLSVLLAIVPAIALVMSYMAVFESKRVGHVGYNYFWLFGSPIIVGILCGILYSLLVPPDAGTRRSSTVFYFGISVAGIYLYLLMFMVLNTLGS